MRHPKNFLEHRFYRTLLKAAFYGSYFFLQFQQQRMILILSPRANMSFVIYCFGQESRKHLGWKTLQLCSSPSQMFAGIRVTLLVAATDFIREVQQNVSKIILTQCSQSFRFVNPFFSIILIFHHLFHRHTTIVRVLQQKIHMQRMDGAHQIAACFHYLPSPHSHLSFALL